MICDINTSTHRDISNISQIPMIEHQNHRLMMKYPEISMQFIMHIPAPTSSNCPKNVQDCVIILELFVFFVIYIQQSEKLSRGDTSHSSALCATGPHCRGDERSRVSPTALLLFDTNSVARSLYTQSLQKFFNKNKGHHRTVLTLEVPS